MRIHCPHMLGILCTQWERGGITARLQTASGWTEWKGGSWQGAPVANPTFCLALHQAMLDTRKKTENGQDDEVYREIGELKVLAYADDAFLLGASHRANFFLDFLEERVANYGWKLELEKSHAWIPSLNLLGEIPREQAHEATLFERMQKSRYGIKALEICCGWRVQRVRRRAEYFRAS